MLGTFVSVVRRGDAATVSFCRDRGLRGPVVDFEAEVVVEGDDAWAGAAVSDALSDFRAASHLLVGRYESAPVVFGHTSRRKIRVASACVVLLLLLSSFAAGRVMFGGDSAASSANVNAWTDDQVNEWCRSPWSGTNEEKAVIILRAHSSGSDAAVCKVAIWLGKSSKQKSRDIHMLAARAMLRDMPNEVIVAAVRRDAHLFGMDPNEVLGRLWKALDQ